MIPPNALLGQSPPSATSQRRYQLWRLPAVLAALAASLALGGCSGASVAVPVAFPIPIVKPLPVTMGLVLDESLTTYRHEESLENNGKWAIDIGGAQTPMFSSLFSGVFANYEQLDTPADQSESHDGVVVPSITQVQFAIPSQTRTDYFEVWIRYQIDLYDGKQLVAQWPITAYGKANVQNYGLVSTSPALTAAALAACRDAMAFFALEFSSDPKIKAWLDSHNSSLATPQAKLADSTL